MKIGEICETIQHKDYDLTFTDYSLNININGSSIYSAPARHPLASLNNQGLQSDHLYQATEQYASYVQVLSDQTEKELAEITDAFVTVVKATLLEYEAKKHKKIRELVDETQ